METMETMKNEHSLADLVHLSVNGVVAVVPLVVRQVSFHDLVSDLYTDYLNINALSCLNI